MRRFISLGILALMAFGSLVLVTDNVAAESRGTGAGVRDEASGCVILDPDAPVQYVKNGYTYNTYGSQFNNNASHWTITGAGGWDEDSVTYPGITYPGQPYLDNGHATTVGYYYIWVSMETPPASATGYYELELWMQLGYSGSYYSHDAWLYGIVGGQTLAAWPYYNSSTNYNYDTDQIYPLASGGSRTWYGEIPTCPATGEAWRASDFGSDWQVLLEYYYSDVITAAMRIQYIYAVLVPVAGPEEVEGMQILYPDFDVAVDDWESVPAGNDLFDMVNESHDDMGDGTSTYVATAIDAILGFGFEDPSELWTEFTNFNLTLWIVAMSSEDDPNDRELRATLTADYGYDRLDLRSNWLGGYWTNNSFTFEVNPFTQKPWTFEEITNVKVFVESTGNMSITQIGVIISDVNYDPETSGLDDWRLNLVGHSGIVSLLGLIGFFGMIATPSIAYLQYKEGEEPLLVTSWGIYLMVFFFGLFFTAVVISSG